MYEYVKYFQSVDFLFIIFEIVAVHIFVWFRIDTTGERTVPPNVLRWEGKKTEQCEYTAPVITNIYLLHYETFKKYDVIRLNCLQIPSCSFK